MLIFNGIEDKHVQGVTFRVYSDCFKYRHKIGLDVAIEALKESVINKTDINEMWDATKVCRVQNIIRPYIGSHL